MTQPTPAQVPPFDGTSGNIVSRAEPKVRAASLTALLSPVVLYYIYDYVPGIRAIPHQLDALLGALIVGALTFAAGFAAKAVDRVDLFVRHEADKVDAAVKPTLVRTFGERAVDDVERYVHELHDAVLPPLENAVKTAISDVEVAVGAGVSPVAALQAEVKPLEEAGQLALDVAVSDGRAEAPVVLAEAVSGLAEAQPALVADVAPTIEQAVVAAGHNQELADMLHHMLELLGEPAATPIGDAVQAGLPTAQASLPPVPEAPQG